MRPFTIVRATTATAVAVVTLGVSAGIAGASAPQDARPDAHPASGSLAAPTATAEFYDLCKLLPTACPESPPPGDPFPNESSFDFCSTFLAKDPETGEEFHREICSTLTIDWGGAAPHTDEG